MFARGRTLEAIEGVCAGDGLDAGGIVDLLTQLVEKSLVTVEKSPEHGARYFLLESLWDYTREKLSEAGETDRFRVRHLDYFLRFAEDAERRITGAEQREWLARMEQEQINFRFAIETGLEIGGQVAKGLRFVAATQRFVEVQGLYKQARDGIARLLAHPDAAPRDAVRACALAAAARLAWVADDIATGAAAQQEALEIFRELSDARGTAAALSAFALYVLEAGDVSTAEKLAAEAAQLAEPLRDRRLTAHVRHTQAGLATAARNYAMSFDLDHESHGLYRELGDVWMQAITEWGVGVSAIVLGKFEEARAHFAKCLQAGLDLGNRTGVPYPIEAFAALAVAEHQHERAARLLGAAESMRAGSGMAQEPAYHPALRAIFAEAAGALASAPAVAARREGRAMSADEAIAFALA